MRLHPVFLLGLVALALVGAANAPTARATPELAPQIFLPLLQSAGVPLQTEQQRQQTEEVVRLLNQERANAGCQPLEIDADLVEAAQAHSADMAQRNYFAHDSPEGVTFVDRMRAAGFLGSPGGENIAAGYPTPTAVMEGWMTSQSHRENMLNCEFRTIGVGYATAPASKYFHYWTQDFGR